MSFFGSNNTKRKQGAKNTDSLEKEKPRSVGGSIVEFGNDTAKKIGEGFQDVGKGLFEQLLGQYSSENAQNYEQYQNLQKEQEEERQLRPEGNLFNFRNIEEERQMNEIKQILKQIQQELEQIKNRGSQMLDKVKDIENTSINSHAETKGVYFLNFLVDILKELQKIGMEIGNSNNWLEAMQSKKAKRGSAFAARSKKQGTAYSMSQEHQVSRNVQ